MRQRFLKNYFFGYGSNRPDVLGESVFKTASAFHDGLRFGVSERDMNYLLALALANSNDKQFSFSYELPNTAVTHNGYNDKRSGSTPFAWMLNTHGVNPVGATGTFPDGVSHKTAATYGYAMDKTGHTQVADFFDARIRHATYSFGVPCGIRHHADTTQGPSISTLVPALNNITSEAMYYPDILPEDIIGRGFIWGEGAIPVPARPESLVNPRIHSITTDLQVVIKPRSLIEPVRDKNYPSGQTMYLYDIFETDSSAYFLDRNGTLTPTTLPESYPKALFYGPGEDTLSIMERPATQDATTLSIGGSGGTVAVPFKNSNMAWSRAFDNARIWREVEYLGPEDGYVYRYYFLTYLGFYTIPPTAPTTLETIATFPPRPTQQAGVLEHLDLGTLTAIMRRTTGTTTSWTIVNIMTGQVAEEPIETMANIRVGQYEHQNNTHYYNCNWYPGERFVSNGYYFSPKMVKPINHLTPFGAGPGIPPTTSTPTPRGVGFCMFDVLTRTGTQIGKPIHQPTTPTAHNVHTKQLTLNDERELLAGAQLGTPTARQELANQPMAFRQICTQVPDPNGFGYWEVFVAPRHEARPALQATSLLSPRMGFCAGTVTTTWHPYTTY